MCSVLSVSVHDIDVIQHHKLIDMFMIQRGSEQMLGMFIIVYVQHFAE